MELLALIKLVPIVLTVVEAVKRFIPDRKRKYANPLVAIITGVGTAYIAGGTEGVLAVIMYGITTGAAAMATYSAPKYIGNKLGIS